MHSGFPVFEDEEKWWFQKIWKWNFPLKLKLLFVFPCDSEHQILVLATPMDNLPEIQERTWGGLAISV